MKNNMDWTQSYLAILGATRREATVVEAKRALQVWEEFGGRHADDFAVWRLAGNGGRGKPSKATVNKQLRMLHAAFEWAVGREEIAKNPIARFRLREDKKVPRTVPLPAVRALLRLADRDPALVALPYMGFYLAMRLGECLGQRSCDLTQDGEQLTIRAHEHCAIKNHAETVMTVPEQARDILCFAREHGPFLVGNEERPLERGRVYAAFRMWSKTIGYDVRPHDLRRTSLSLAANRGAAPAQLRAFARHASIDTTMRYYVHASAGDVPTLVSL